MKNPLVERAVALIVWNWDPLGVVDALPDTIDEYDSLITRIAGRVTQRGDIVSVVRDFLEATEVEISMAPLLENLASVRSWVDRNS